MHAGKRGTDRCDRKATDEQKQSEMVEVKEDLWWQKRIVKENKLDRSRLINLCLTASLIN